jgi:ABC-type glycerol-3-phosphate transport system substrate-binding protein
MAERATALTRRRFIGRLGLLAGAGVMLPLVAACTRGTPSTPTIEGTPTADPDTTLPLPSPALLVPPDTTLRFLTVSGSSAAADEALRALAREWASANGLQVAFETASAAAIAARVAAPDGLAGLDIVQCRDNLAHLYPDHFADLSVEAGALAASLGGFYDAPTAQARVEGVWRALPFNLIPSAIAYRVDLLKEAGAAAFPATLAELLTIGAALKAKGHPFGAPAGRSPEDPRALWYAVLWAFGGRTIEADGATIAINSPETLAALGWARDFWAAACLPDGLAWDDNGNNLAYANGQIAATQNGPALYLGLRENQGDLAALTALAPFPAGPGGRGVPVTTHAHAVPTGATNAPIARAFLGWLGAREQAERYLTAAGGAVVAPARGLADCPLWAADPKLRAFLNTAEAGRPIGWPAVPSRVAAAADAHFVVVDMFAGVVAGGTPGAAIAAAESALRNLAALGAGA